MTLSRSRSYRRDRRICRFGVMLVVVSLVINMVAVPKAEAVVLESSAALGAAATVCVVDYSTAAVLLSGMKVGAAQSAVVGLMGEYAAATGVASSGAALASTIGAGTIITAAGTVVLTAAAGYAVYKFIEWLREDKGLEAGGIAVGFEMPGSITLINGTVFELSTQEVLGSVLPCSEDDVLSSVFGCYFERVLRGSSILRNFGVDCVYLDGSPTVSTINTIKSGFTMPWGLGYDSAYDAARLYSFDSEGNCLSSDLFGSVNHFYTLEELLNVDSSAITYGQTYSLQPKPEFQTIPQEIPEGQVLKIDTGLESLPANDPQAAADAIMQTAIDGALDPVVTVEADPTVTPDPDPEPDPDPDPEPVPDAPELPSNLGDLGEALTTRFPFSIPWDIAKAVKLLAAPAQAPYWEVDFLEPMAHRLPNGWQGSTTITLDFGKPEFEIIGITTRWTSTIGFCLALAAATKRFIWTA